MSTDLATRVAVRSRALDAFRGLAVLSMIVDHLCIVLAGPVELRYTVGRLAFPAFFLLAGHLATRPRWRHAGVALLGLLLPLWVPWIDAPNVLLLWAAGVALLWVQRRLGVPLWLPLLVALAVAANGWAVPRGGGYDPLHAYALLALGAMVPRSAFGWADRAPEWVAGIGRRPIRWYVGHILVLDAAGHLLWGWLR